MEGIGVKELSQIKLAVKAKLAEIGAYVDEELPDYILVMITNRRSKEQMKSDLSLFLGNHTDTFTEWLYLVLKRLEAFTKDKVKVLEPSKDHKDSRVRDSSHSSAPLAPKAVVPEPADDMDDDCLNVRNEDDQHDFHVPDQPVKKQVDTKDILDKKRRSAGDRSSEREVKRVCRDERPRERRDDRTRPRDDHRYRDYRPRDERSGDDRPRDDRSRDDRPRPRDDRPRLRDDRPRPRDDRPRTRDGPRSPPRSDRRQRPRDDPAATAKPVTADSRPKIGSVVRPMASFIQPPSSVQEPANQVEKADAGVPSVIRITPRPRVPNRLQATKSLVLKAVADAQKSVAAAPKVAAVVAAAAVPEPASTAEKPPMALFTRRYREQNLANGAVVSNAPTSAEANVTFAAAEPTPEPAEAEEVLVEVEEEVEENSEEAVVEEEEEFLEQPLGSPEEEEQEEVETRFIVTLDGFHLDVDELMGDGDDGEEEDMKEEINQRYTEPATPSNVKSRLYRRRSTGSDAAMQQTLERGKYVWPSNRQGEQNKFQQPTLRSKVLPNCKFGASCTRKNCPFPHTGRLAAPAAAVTTATKKRTLCLFFPLCHNVSCQFYHPLACKFGSNCTRGGCSFYHPEKAGKSIPPPMDKLKWVATK